MRRAIPLVAILLLGLGLSVGLTGPRKSHDDVFTDEGLLASSAKNLKSTEITPHLEAPLAPGRSVLWCGTFQLAWNQLCDLVGEDVHFTSDPPMVAALNKKAVTVDHLDAASYVAVADFVRNGVFARIEKALKDKFGGQASPHWLPNPSLTPRPQDIVAYTYLVKYLEFATPFERLDEPLVFESTAVSAFGLGPYKRQQNEMLPQVGILDYEGPDDFVIELKTKSTDDQVILAKVRPGATLEETVAAVLGRAAAATPAEARPGDVLQVPRFNFDLVREYTELYGRFLVVTNPAVAKDLQVLSAVQNVRFQMDEKGMRLRSEGHGSGGCSAEAPPPVGVREMIFDKPFLVLLKRAEAPVPYFALWVGSPELLVPAAGK